MPEIGSDAWHEIKEPAVWLPGVDKGGYGRADPLEEAYQAVYPKGLKARYIKTAGANKLLFYDANRIVARKPLLLQVEDIDSDGQSEIFITTDNWPMLMRRNTEKEQWAVIDPDGEERSRHISRTNLQFVQLLDIDGSGKKRIVQASIDSRIDVYEHDGELLKHMDLYQMHKQFNETKGRPNTRHPAGLYPTPFAIGMWRPAADGRRKFAINRYCALSFIDEKGEFEGVLHAWGYTLSALLSSGVDFSGDGQEEQLSLSLGRILHLDGDDTPGVRDNDQNHFYPQVYRVQSITEPEWFHTLDGARVFVFETFPWGHEPDRNVLIARENYIGIYDGKARKIVFSWAPEVLIKAAAMSGSDSEHLQVIALTADNLLWRIDWRDQLDKVDKFSTAPIGHNINSIAVSANDPGLTLLAGEAGLYLLDSGQKLSMIDNGSYRDAKWLGDSIAATTTGGLVVRLDPHEKH